MRVSLRNNKGFSLVELMIVVAIIGVLAAIGVPQFQKFQARARQSEGKGYLAAIYTGEKAYFAEWNSYLSCLDQIGVVTNGGQFEGKGVYRAGFSGPAVAFPAGAPNTCNTASAAPALQAAPVPVAIAVADGPVASAPSATFQAAAVGNIRALTPVGLTDIWRITDTKTLSQTQNGL